MTKTKRTIGQIIWAFLLLLAGSHFSFGQQQSYSGKYILGKYEGTAQYTYRVEGIDTIFDGDFKLERSNLGALLKSNDRSFAIQGSFEDGRPEGDWLFQFGEFYTDSTAQVSGFQYQVNVNGTLLETKGILNSGKPNGKWKVALKKVEGSQIIDTLFYSEVNFLDGIPQQSFRIEGLDSVLVGRFLRNGLAHDTWSLYSNEAINIENWHFLEGRLTKIEKGSDGEFQSIDVFPNPHSKETTVSLDNGFIKLIEIYANFKTDSSIESSNGINHLLQQNHANYQKVEDILSELGTTNFLSEFKVTAPHFPLDEASVEQLDSTVQLTKRGAEISRSFLENTRLNLLKRSDGEADALYQKVAALDSSFVQPLRSLVELHKMGILENLNEEMLASYVFPNGPPTIPSLSESDNKSFNLEQKGAEGYLAMAQYASERLNQISDSLGQKLADDKKQQEFVLLEEQMIAQANGLNQVSDSVLQELSKPALQALDNIKKTAEQLLGEYAEMPTGTEKLNQARILINCLLHFDQLSQEIIELPTRSKELETTYKDAVFNPFTATIMDEMVKKRITSAYKNVLIPYLFGEVENELDCENAESFVLLFQNTHRRMLELREEDTAKLERKLRKEQNPKVVLQLFNLKPSGN